MIIDTGTRSVTAVADSPPWSTGSTSTERSGGLAKAARGGSGRSLNGLIPRPRGSAMKYKYCHGR
jgi:hypothetical protein